MCGAAEEVSHRAVIGPAHEVAVCLEPRAVALGSWDRAHLQDRGAQAPTLGIRLLAVQVAGWRARWESAYLLLCEWLTGFL